VRQSHPTPPDACLRAYHALILRYGHTAFSRIWGCFRYHDIVDLTGHLCDGKKLRELVMFDRNLVCRQDWIIPNTDNRRASRFRVFWINPEYSGPPVGRDLDQDNRNNPPAVAPHDVRLIPRKIQIIQPVIPSDNGLLFEMALPGRPE